MYPGVRQILQKSFFSNPLPSNSTIQSLSEDIFGGIKTLHWDDKVKEAPIRGFFKSQRNYLAKKVRISPGHFIEL